MCNGNFNIRTQFSDRVSYSCSSCPVVDKEYLSTPMSSFSIIRNQFVVESLRSVCIGCLLGGRVGDTQITGGHQRNL
ncbi:MAG: hypothetical protein IPN15_07045 [Saprospiraceae bacterium]|nr:hypothetical protein [Candidatus Vicinibacter affinis]